MTAILSVKKNPIILQVSRREPVVQHGGELKLPLRKGREPISLENQFETNPSDDVKYERRFETAMFCAYQRLGGNDHDDGRLKPRDACPIRTFGTGRISAGVLDNRYRTPPAEITLTKSTWETQKNAHKEFSSRKYPMLRVVPLISEERW
ncbi:hypothetical protein BDY19DRAFT_1049571 [Irpex rosettiformis]|uniref:Uncharacterized protein n=1 Tax=Irpex rosettiformis TaxID=378272 RepID=A0ACB8TZ54_9APHY|nr:hypothetical protein BDY19DRAFT_1049571 [Irpex rosettiformis]